MFLPLHPLSLSLYSLRSLPPPSLLWSPSLFSYLSLPTTIGHKSGRSFQRSCRSSSVVTVERALLHSASDLSVAPIRLPPATSASSLSTLSSLSRSYATPSGIVSFLSLSSCRKDPILARSSRRWHKHWRRASVLWTGGYCEDLWRRQGENLALISLCHLAGDRRIFPATAVAVRRPRASSVFTNEGMTFPLCFVLVIKLLISVCFFELVLVKIIVRPFS